MGWQKVVFLAVARYWKGFAKDEDVYMKKGSVAMSITSNGIKEIICVECCNKAQCRMVIQEGRGVWKEVMVDWTKIPKQL